MARSQTFQTLLDRAESPVQTHILLAQLQLLRKQERERRRLDA